MSDNSKDKEEDLHIEPGYFDGLLRARSKLGEKPATTVRIFERNTRYYCLDKDAELVARYVYGSVTATKTMMTGADKNTPVTYSITNQGNFESLLRYLILVKHYRVEIYKFSKASSYDLEVRASPGNIAPVEHILYGESDIVKDCNYLAGIKITGGAGADIRVGVTAVDSSLNIIKMSEFSDTEGLFAIEAALVQLRPREVIIPQSDIPIMKKVETLLKRNRILITHKPNSDFVAMSEDDVKRVCHEKTNQLSFTENPLASGVCTALLKYLGLHADPDGKVFRVEMLNTQDFMRIDNRTVTGLNIFDEPGHTGSSIFYILNKTRTPGGMRLLQTWIKQPLIQRDLVCERLNLVEHFVENADVRQSLYEDHLRRMPDFQRIATKFQNKKANLQEMYKVYLAVTKLRALKELLETFGEDATLIKENFIKDINESLKDFEKYMQLVESTLDFDQVKNGVFLIKASFDDQLGELREELDSVEEKVQSALQSLRRELNLDKQLMLEHSSSKFGYYFRLTMKEEKAVRNDRSMTILESNKSGVKFRNKKLESLNDQHADLFGRYEQQQQAIVEEMLGIAAGYADIMNHLGMLISKLDVIVAFALAAVSAPTPYVKPEILPESDDRKMNFTGLRHPIVELQESVSYIPNDVEFEKDKSIFHIITGPNMGGKSTYIRSVGTAVLMAQIGSFVPADSATMSVMDSIMVRIGSSDCQIKGISTFMAEMLETSNILNCATEKSLILIDELGRGTSTYDGFGVAWAVSEHIAKIIKCFTLFTTHFTELTQLAEEIGTVRNYHVSALVADQKLTLLYQIQPGVCDKSFGIHVAELVNFPKDIIQDANRRLARLERGLPMEVN